MVGERSVRVVVYDRTSSLAHGRKTIAITRGFDDKQSGVCCCGHSELSGSREGWFMLSWMVK